MWSTRFYTKKGDNGTTTLSRGRVSKNSRIIKLMGSLDSLQAELALLESVINDEIDTFWCKYIYVNRRTAFLTEVKKYTSYLIGKMYEVMGSLHTGTECSSKILKSVDSYLDKTIFPRVNKFVLPDPNDKVNVYLHKVRTEIRKVEIKAVDILEALSNTEPLQDIISGIVQLLNRLSSLYYGFIILL